MALKNTADGQLLQTTVGLWNLNSQGYTIACWARLDTTKDWAAIASFGTDYAHFSALYIRSDSINSYYPGLWDQWSVTGPAITQISAVLTAGTWYYIAASRAAGASGATAVYVWPLNGALASGTGTAHATAPTTPADFTVHDDSPYTGENSNSTLAHFKLWNAVLTQGELQREMYAFRPPRWGNLALWCPLTSRENTYDLSGNGRHLIQTGTLTADPGPPVQLLDLPRGYSRSGSTAILRPVSVPATRVLIGVSAGGTINGTLGATEAPDTAALSGQVWVSGSLSATEAQDALALAAQVLVSGSLSATEAPDSASLNAQVQVSGTLAASEAQDTASVAGTVLVIGSLVAVEGSDTCALAGQVVLSGLLDATEDQDALIFAGAAPPISGTLTATEAGDSADFAGVVLIGGTLDMSDAADTAAWAGAVRVTGTFDLLEASDTATLTGGIQVAGALSGLEVQDVALFIETPAIPSGSDWYGRTRRRRNR